MKKLDPELEHKAPKFYNRLTVWKQQVPKWRMVQRGELSVSLLITPRKKITSGKEHVAKIGTCVGLEGPQEKNLGVKAHRWPQPSFFFLSATGGCKRWDPKHIIRKLPNGLLAGSPDKETELGSILFLLGCFYSKHSCVVGVLKIHHFS